MYKSIERLRKLKREKLGILDGVYQSYDLDEVCEKQRDLGSMTVSIYTDVANELMPVFQEDGVNNIVWSNISIRLEKLSFTSIPTASEIREKYKKGVENPTVVEVSGEYPPGYGGKSRPGGTAYPVKDCSPRPGEKRKVNIELPSFLAILAAQGIAVPLILNIFGVPRWALVLVDVSLMTIEVVAYFGTGSKEKNAKFESKKGTTESAVNYSSGSSKSISPLARPKEGTTESAVNYERMYRKAIQEVYDDNRNRLNIWFDDLENITKEEIDKELGKSGGTI